MHQEQTLLVREKISLARKKSAPKHRFSMDIPVDIFDRLVDRANQDNVHMKDIILRSVEAALEAEG